MVEVCVWGGGGEERGKYAEGRIAPTAEVVPLQHAAA